MSMSERDEEQGRGLPVGWGWGYDATLCTTYLADPDGQRRVTITSDGTWIAWDRADNGGPMAFGQGPMPVEQAQREAVAALWARDGFGVGEVRGLVLGDEWAMPVGFALDATKPSPMALPGLPGLWTLTRVSSARPITVDAARAPVAPEHADGCAYYFADAADAESLCNCRGGTPRVTVEPGKPLPVSFSGLRAAGYEVAPVAEPAPRPTCPGGAEAHNRALLAGHRCTACGVARQDAEDAAPWRWVPTIHRLPSGTETVMLGSPDRAEPALREPSASLFGLGLLGDAGAAILRAADGAEPPAPTGDPGADLTELLPGLPAAVATLRGIASLQLGEPYREIAQQVALGAELLLGERATQPKALASYLDVQWSDEPMREGETVAEQAIRLLEDRREKQDIATRTVLAQGAEIATLRARVDELEAAVRQVEQERSCDLAVLDATAANLHSAERRLATLGAPSPLDLAVAEVCAVDVAALVGPEMSAAAIGDAIDRVGDGCEDEPQRKSLAKMGALCLAGMLACAPTDGGKEPG